MQKVITLGNGFVAAHLPYEKILDRFEFNNLSVEKIIDKYKPDIIINTIGFCGGPGKNVDQCEVEKIKTYNTNVTLPLLIAEHCENKQIKHILLGSGCIYFGDSPHTTYTSDGCNIDGSEKWDKIDSGFKETDFANPESYYSKSKYSADLMLSQLKMTCIARIRMPISDKNTPRNLINKLLGYKKILNQPNSVTFMSDFTRCIDWMIKNDKSGIYHVTNPDPLTHIELLEEYKKYVPTHQYDSINIEQLKDLIVAPRSNCILNTNKLKSEGFHMTPTKQALQDCMVKYIKNCKLGELT